MKLKIPLSNLLTHQSPPQDPDDPDDPDQLPDPEEEEEEQQEEDQEEAEEGQQEEPEEGQGEEAEEEKEEEDPLQLVESDSTKRSRKIKERKEKIDMAALTRLPYALSDKGLLYKGTMNDVKDNPQASRKWSLERDHLLRSRTKHPSVMWAIGRLKTYAIIRSALYSHFRNTW